ncbi:MAG TPA: class I SAM-dependent methyltransferase [Caulobacteraceae bacterium]|nr:class I SAM-dependent methyltransferase [Caulobacteraceae bacterium]
MSTGGDLPREFGRQAFGADPAGYNRARPAYPDWVYETLRSRCGLARGCATFEVGAGTGIATRRLLREGASPLVAIEPDSRLAAFLEASVETRALRVVNAPFEAADLPDAGFDLGVCATAFHWLDEDAALGEIARLLKPGGWWAAVWNVFGDASRPDPFHDATTGLFEGASSSPGTPGGHQEYGLDAEARISALERSGAFDAIDYQVSHWPLELTADETVALYATYSNVNARADRAELLAGLHRIASGPPFSDRVVRNMTTSLFIARRA